MSPSFAAKTDSTTRKRMDDRATIDFLTACAHALQTGKKLSAHDVESFRLSLAGVNFGESSFESLLLQLEQSSDQLVEKLVNRYGKYNLWRNLMRYTLKLRMQNLVTVLSEFGHQLIQVSQMAVNRPMQIYVGQNSDRNSVWASALHDLILSVEQTCSHLLDISTEKMTLIGCDHPLQMSSERELDSGLAKALGFDSVQDEYLPGVKDHQFKVEAFSALYHFCFASRAYLQQVQQNNSHDEIAQLVVLCDALFSRAQGLLAFQFPQSCDFAALESSRFEMAGLWDALINYADEFTQKFLDLVPRHFASQGSPHKLLLGGNFNRAMAQILIETGVNVKDALQASQDLVAYLSLHELRPKQVIAAELSKINPRLTVASLEVLKKLDEQSEIAAFAFADKELTQKALPKFKTFFSDAVKISSMICLIAAAGFFVNSCGVKTGPRSELIDYRPAVSYKPQRDVPKQPSASNPKEKTPVPTLDTKK